MEDPDHYKLENGELAKMSHVEYIESKRIELEKEIVRHKVAVKFLNEQLDKTSTIQLA